VDRDPVPPHRDGRDVPASRQRLAGNKRFGRPQHQGPVPAAGPGRLLGLRLRVLPHLGPHHQQEIYYYRCLGSDDYRYEGGRVCGNQPVRADYLDTVVWDHITALLADPALIRAEISKRLMRPHRRPGHPGSANAWS